MKKIINPWRNHEGYNCFGCSPDNPIGLHNTAFQVHTLILNIGQFHSSIGRTATTTAINSNLLVDG